MEPVWYCVTFGTVVAGVVTTAFRPFGRKREKPEKKQPAEAQAKPQAKPQPKSQREAFLGSDKDRVNVAMRQWAAVRADDDLQFSRPQPPLVPPAPPVTVKTFIIDATPPSPVKTQPPAGEPETGLTEPNPFMELDFQGSPNFYEVLQISPRADLDTIHRVYRIMAGRFHPDNPVSGDHERFIQLQEAYDVLSRPDRRCQYDLALQARESKPMPIFGTRIFVDGIDGEMNRRFGVLALLYQRRRLNQGGLGISVLDLERRMSLPREHLEFTLWYLRMKGYVHVLEDNSDYAITAMGVDHVEQNSSKNKIVRDVLTAAAPPAPAPPRTATAPATTKKNKRAAKTEGRKARRQHVEAIVAA